MHVQDLYSNIICSVTYLYPYIVDIVHTEIGYRLLILYGVHSVAYSVRRTVVLIKYYMGAQNTMYDVHYLTYIRGDHN